MTTTSGDALAPSDRNDVTGRHWRGDITLLFFRLHSALTPQKLRQARQACFPLFSNAGDLSMLCCVHTTNAWVVIQRYSIAINRGPIDYRSMQ